MKVSYSGRSDHLQEDGQESGIGKQASERAASWFGVPRFIIVVAVAYVLVHAALLAPSLEDIDSINFALGLRHFDVAAHQPHPPGYPVYIALGHISSAVIRTVAPSLDRSRSDALALAIWSAIGSGIVLLAAWWIFSSIATRQPTARGGSGALTTVAVLLLAASPLFWISSGRPLSDMPGLAFAMLAQALALRSDGDRKRLVAAACVAGLAAGVRVQTACLTLPILVWAAWRHRHAALGWVVSRSMAALVIGALVWVVPLVVLSGGVDGYLRALGSQAGEDFAWTGMLWMNPTPRRLAFALWETFALPWDGVPLALTIGAFSAVGLLVAAVRDRRALAVIATAFGPYILFHLVLQETAHVRYALPTVPLVVWLAARGAAATGPVAPYVGAALTAFALVVSVPAGIAYARQPHPAFRAIEEMQATAATAPPAAIYSHFSLRRPLQASAPAHVPIVEPRRSYEWLGPVDYWRSGGVRPVWFLADSRRTDLALIDPRSRTHVTRFRWGVADRWILSGARPTAVDWYVFDRPGWFAGEGWALTPEVGGISQATGTGVDHRPIEAYVRRRSGPMHLLVGGRHFSAAGDPPVIFDLAIEGTTIETWRVDPAAGGISFLRFIDLPRGLPPGSGEYARLTISARAEPPSRQTPQVVIRQFDIQSSGTFIYGFGEGWHEEEYETATGLRWRWTSDRSVLRIAPPQDVELVLRGESPLKYFDAPPGVRIKVGDRVVSELHPERAFEWRVKVPGDLVQQDEGAIAIEVDRVYLPGKAEGTSDTRRLGLRLFETTVTPVSSP